MAEAIGPLLLPNGTNIVLELPITDVVWTSGGSRLLGGSSRFKEKAESVSLQSLYTCWSARFCEGVSPPRWTLLVSMFWVVVDLWCSSLEISS